MGKQDEQQEPISVLEQKLEELRQLIEKKVFLSRNRYNYNFRRWRSETEYILRNGFGNESREFINFENAATLPDTKATPAQWEIYRSSAMVKVAAELGAIISAIENHGKPEMHQTMITPKVLIAHGGETIALSKVKTFISALGANPLVAEEEPSEGRSVNGQVEWCLNNADCAIILGTCDDKNLKDGKLYPRPNVCIEIGRVEEKFPNRVIYLLEKDASFPSNISEKVYEQFTQTNMEKALLKIVVFKGRSARLEKKSPRFWVRGLAFSKLVAGVGFERFLRR